MTPIKGLGKKFNIGLRPPFCGKLLSATDLADTKRAGGPALFTVFTAVLNCSDLCSLP